MLRPRPTAAGKAGGQPPQAARAVARTLFPYWKSLKTITTDNGCEFAAHLEITGSLSIKGQPPVMVYFADPYSFCQKCAVENANKLIRKYIPKKSNFNDFSDKRILEIQKNKLYPPEKLNFDSPKKTFLREYLLILQLLLDSTVAGFTYN